MRWLPALSAFAVLGVVPGCGGGGGEPPTPPPAEGTPMPSATPMPRTLTPEDDGATFETTVGVTGTLRVSDPTAADPEVSGSAVLVIRKINIAPTDSTEWEVRAVATGRSVIRSATPMFEITIVVR